jgi:hypothetical protein
MRWLNDRVPYRYTAIFAFEGEMLHNICLIDKDNSTITNCSDQSITESYCMYIHPPASVSMWSRPCWTSGSRDIPNNGVFSATTAFHYLAPLIAEAAFGAKETIEQESEV